MVLIVFILFFILLALSVPIAVSMGISTIFPALIDPDFAVNAAYVVRSMIKGVDSTALVAVPLFMLSGAIMATGGLSKQLFNCFSLVIGKLRGGMPCAVVITCLFYGAISGSGPATCAAVGAMCIPVLTNLGYDKVFSAALVATAAGLGVIIPPSIPYIAYAMVTDVSVGALFMAGILPGVLIAAVLMIYTVVYCIKSGENRERVIEEYKALKKHGAFKVFVEAIPALLTPVIILGGIYTGWLTPTDAACVSVIYSIIVCLFIYKSVKVSELLEFFRQGVKSFAPMAAMMALAQGFVKLLVFLDAPDVFAEFLAATVNNKVTFLLILNALLILLGMVIDVGPANMILAPMLIPFASSLGVSPVHLGIIMTCNLAIGFVTPPFGMNLFVAAPMIKVDAMVVGRRAMPLILFYIIALMLITFIPQISLCLLGNNF